MSFTQANRLIAIDTPLGDDVLLLQGFTGREGVSQLFKFDLDLLSVKSDINFKDIIGQSVTIRILLSDGSSERYFNGVVSRFAQSGSGTQFTNYQMEVVPWLWFLTRVADCRIFQNLSIPDIIKKVFQSRGYSKFKTSLTATYDPVDYCVQYRETDFNFVSRLMEHSGIFYYFEHEDGEHTLVLADSPTAHQACPEQESASYNLSSGDLDSEDVITAWHMEQELRTGKYSVTDYNFETPSASLMANEPTVVQVGGNTKFEIYDYPGDHPTSSKGSSVAKLRMQEEEASHTVITGSSVCRAFTSGYKFDLKEHYRDDMNDSYVITEVQHTATVGSYGMGNANTPAHYSNHFTCIPASVPYRPPRVTPKPFVQGPQTALVVGKSGEEIWVDKYGRVKVQFYWDRQGQKDENSSCWVRVSQPWAGQGWGAVWIPRMGQEVVVSFIEGDPDRPLITGRVYNADQTTPYALPDHQTVSTFMSKSSKGGGSANYNEIRFEDKTGHEQIFINAERDMDQRVEVDSREFVGANRHLNVGANQTENIGADKDINVAGNHTESIGKDMMLTVGNDLLEAISHDQHLIVNNNLFEDITTDVHRNIGGNRIENVGTNFSLNIGANRAEAVGGNLDLSVGANRTEAVGANQSLSVGSNSDESIGENYSLTAGQNVSIEGGMNVVITAGMQISLVGPGGFITIGPAGVAIQGTMVMINSGGSAGSGTSASTQNPKSPGNPKAPKQAQSPKSPQIADDGSKFSEM
ncbi:MAG TPA: type VI secretion system tip protein TssI/VgrG [Terriglobales bacterium]|nr:type VI secretion system tip protein TssI/VgrG [Terriglobales bacterium]